MNKPLELRIGDRVLGVEVLEIESGPPPRRRTWRYRVRYDCCGREGWLTHAGLMNRLFAQHHGRTEYPCLYCAAKIKAATKIEREAQARERALRPPTAKHRAAFGPWR